MNTIEAIHKPKQKSHKQRLSESRTSKTRASKLNQQRKKIVIIHTDFNDPGGVSAYYSKLKGKFTASVDHFISGKRPGEKGILLNLFRMMSDLIRFEMLLWKRQYDIVHINPSLDPKSFLRDSLFICLGRMQKRKTVVFFRGWQKSFQLKLENKFSWLFKYLYSKTDAFVVLSKEFKKALESWGCRQPIYTEVTVIDDDAIKGLNIYKVIDNRQNSYKWKILFLSRLQKTKGIYETIDAVSLLETKFPQLELIIAGDGDELQRAKAYVNEHNIKNVTFTGYVRGEEKKLLLEHSQIFCYPTYYGEGLPNTIIESMAFGLPIITRPVGGLTDFFENGKHGFASASMNPKTFAHFIERLMEDQELYKTISLFNYRYAQEHFKASDAASRLERIYESILKLEDR